MILTNDQQKALEGLQSFVLDDTHIYVLQGYAGTGKSTLLKEFLKQLPDLLAGYTLVNPAYVPRHIAFTATTHKAVENLMGILPISYTSLLTTTASAFGMRLQQAAASGKPPKLVFAGNRALKFGRHSLIFIDEASYLDSELLSHISRIAVEMETKIVFIGDPAQLTPVMSNHSPVFSAGFPTSSLTEVVRQAKTNPIMDLVTEYRNAVRTKVFPAIPHGLPEIQYMDVREEVADYLKAHFSDPAWNPNHSRILGYTNNRVTLYNDWLAEKIEGSSLLVEGGYYLNNRGVNLNSCLLPASATVLVLGITRPFDSVAGITGSWLTLAHNGNVLPHLVFAPHNYRDWAYQHKIWIKEDNQEALHLSSTWVDLRRLYASTVNKAQGSTFDECFIDLADIATCRSAEQRARLLYVATSRARNRVTFINLPRR